MAGTMSSTCVAYDLVAPEEAEVPAGGASSRARRASHAKLRGTLTRAANKADGPDAGSDDESLGSCARSAAPCKPSAPSRPARTMSQSTHKDSADDGDDGAAHAAARGGTDESLLDQEAKEAERVSAEYRASAKQGDADARYYLGCAYGVRARAFRAHGKLRSAARAEAKAARWWALAAQQGQREAQFEFGTCVLNGVGAPKRPADGAMWVLAASQQQLPRAQRLLGLLLCEGRGVPRDSEQGAFWLRCAANGGVGAGTPASKGRAAPAGGSPQPKRQRALQLTQTPSPVPSRRPAAMAVACTPPARRADEGAGWCAEHAAQVAGVEAPRAPEVSTPAAAPRAGAARPVCEHASSPTLADSAAARCIGCGTLAVKFKCSRCVAAARSFARRALAGAFGRGSVHSRLRRVPRLTTRRARTAADAPAPDSERIGPSRCAAAVCPTQLSRRAAVLRGMHAGSVAEAPGVVCSRVRAPSPLNARTREGSGRHRKFARSTMSHTAYLVPDGTGRLVRRRPIAAGA